MSKQFVSLDQALSYLQFINKDSEAFTQKDFKLPQAASNQKVAPVVLRKPVEPIKLNEKNEDYTQQSSGKRTLNKNRAIKRIIDTSKQILENNYRYQEPPPNEKKSYVTQFNIYLKQYNRLSEQILSQQHEKEEKKRQFIQHEQNKLENLYSFTVQQDFREFVQVSILKDKINKTNVQMVMETFKLSLVVLRTGELKIYEPGKEQFSRDIKLHQIENVDYFNQPYIFTVMTIVKDKSSTSQFLCFKFDCIQKQHKWDRAIYCNYIVRKMKTKGRYFLLQFPQKKEQKQGNEGLQHVIKKRDDVRNYEVDRKKVIKNLMSEKQKQKEGTRMGTAGMDTQRDLPTTQKRDNKIQRFNTENQINVLMSPTRDNANYNMMSTKNAEQKNIFDNSVKGSKRNTDNQQEDGSVDKSKLNSSARQNLNQNINQNPNNSANNPNSGSVAGSKNTPVSQLGNPNGNGPMENKNNEDIRESNRGAKLLQNILGPNLAESEVSADVDENKKKQNKIINPFTKRKIQLKEKHQKGIMVQKIKFFIDKPKLIYLGNDELEYWDYDAATMYKSQKKCLGFKQMKTYKMIKTQKTQYIRLQLKNKQLQFTGKAEDLDDLIEWIELPNKERQFEVQLANRNQTEEDKSIKNKNINNDKLIF